MDIDLNLLRVFDALMEHRSVTRASSHLGVTQPAVSHALARLRKVFDDPLFIRAQTGLQPTSRAEEMAAGVRRGLQELQGALARKGFDPSNAERHFTIAAGNYFNTLIIPALVERIRGEASGISLRLIPVTEMLVPLFDQGVVDLALGSSFEAPARLVLEPLYPETMVWIAAPGNPLVRGRLTAEALAREPRVEIVPSRPFEAAGRSGEARAPSFPPADQVNWAAHAPPRGGVTVYESQAAVALVARTDLIAQVPSKVAAAAVARGEVVALACEAEDDGYDLVMIWHAKQRSDPGLAWLRDQIRRAALENPDGA